MVIMPVCTIHITFRQARRAMVQFINRINDKNRDQACEADPNNVHHYVEGRCRVGGIKPHL